MAAAHDMQLVPLRLRGEAEIAGAEVCGLHLCLVSGVAFFQKVTPVGGAGVDAVQDVYKRQVFYRVGTETESFLQLCSLLDSLNVEVVCMEPPEGNYEAGYLQILEEIQGQL